jgi:enolase
MENNVKLRRDPKSIVSELADIVKTFESYVMVERPLRNQDVQELSWLISVVEERIELYGLHCYRTGKAEKGLFDE